ncbi:sensor histidine kinase [Microbacterium sp. P06]|uniref:sensor histidine kinase n=1 Tax=unclassified Microbacterium TaxID=2609290 RepID=UPI003745D114
MTTATPEKPAAKRQGRVFSLQARLMTAIIGMVAIILAIIALGTSAILSNVLQDNLQTKVRSQVQELRAGPQSTASEMLNGPSFADGTVLVVRNFIGQFSGAYVDGGEVRELDADQVSGIVTTLLDAPASEVVDLPGLGEYRMAADASGSYVLGLPLTDVTSTIAQILTTIALVTTGGLLLLGAVIAIVIRAGLKPLHAVAETAQRVAAVRMDQGEVSITERVPAEEADDRTEIGQVGAALNSLLDHVDASLAARQQNEELMRRFVADASHELRTPLASIRGYSELSLRDRTLSDTSHEALARIQAQSLRMTTLVEDLLLLARLDEGQELVYGTVELTQLALEAVGDARPAGPDHNWEIDVPDEPVQLAGDTSRLHQVVANLLANARTHTPAGTTVTVSVRREGDEAVLRVHDDGPGVDPAIADELFERFSRADRSRARKTGGTGLGLSIARAIAQAHGGTLSVRSIPGDTTFEVRLPAKPSDPA